MSAAASIIHPVFIPVDGTGRRTVIRRRRLLRWQPRERNRLQDAPALQRPAEIKRPTARRRGGLKRAMRRQAAKAARRGDPLLLLRVRVFSSLTSLHRRNAAPIDEAYLGAAHRSASALTHLHCH